MPLYPAGRAGDIGEPRTAMPIVDGDRVKVEVGAGPLNLLEGLTAVAAELNALDPDDIQAVIPTADGLTTAIISGGKLLTVVAVASADADHIVTLPAPVPGTIVVAYAGALGYELATSAPATVGLGGDTPGAGHESAIPADSIAVVFCISATMWVGLTITGQTLAAIETAA